MLHSDCGYFKILVSCIRWRGEENEKEDCTSVFHVFSGAFLHRLLYSVCLWIWMEYLYSVSMAGDWRHSLPQGRVVCFKEREPFKKDKNFLRCV